MNFCMFKRGFIFACILSFLLSLTTYYLLPTTVSAEMTEQEKQAQEAKWREELAATEADIAKWQSILDSSKKNTASLQNDAAILVAKINEAKAFIRQRQVQIEQLSKQIGEKDRHIAELDQRIIRGRQSLASMLRAADTIDDYSLPEIILSNQNISSFFEDISDYDSIKVALADKFAEIRGLQDELEVQKKDLDKKRTQEADTKAKIEEDKKRVERDEAEKQRLININKTQEKTYSQVIAEKQKKAAEIRAALFALRDAQAIPFGDALKYAQSASAKTGVRPALILAILTQESALGKNQGSCLVSSLETGDGVGKNTGTFFEQVMKAPRDTVPFESITKRLGKDWKMTPVSCPLGYKYVSGRGFGGAMGPSQFIPSTWELMKNRLGADLGLDADNVNPWNPEHAVMATALYMADLGAAAGGYTAETRAACKYYGTGGSSCSYGQQVLAKAQNIQLNMIDPLNF